MSKKEFTKDEKAILEDVITVIAVLFEKPVKEVKQTLIKLGNFDDLIMCLLCSHSLEMPLHLVLEARELGNIEGELEHVKTLYTTDVKDWH